MNSTRIESKEPAPTRPLNLAGRLVFLLSLGLSTWNHAAAEPPRDFHVAVNGNDANAGSAAQPFATLTRARDAVRQLPDGGRGRILVHGGAYYDVSLILEPQDSDLTIEAAPGEKPVLYGGIPLRNWKPEGKFWGAELPPHPAKTAWEVRWLVLNGESRPRARHPATGTLTHETSFTVPWMSSTGGGWKRKPTHEELTTLEYQAGDLGPWLEIANAEITVYHMWDESCVGITAHDPAKRTLTLAPEPGHPPGAFGVKKYVLWNIREGMTKPGQWYHDRAKGRIVYWPKPGEQMEEVQAVVPTQTTIVRLQGERSKAVRNVTILGLGLSATTVPLVAGGFGAARFDGAISLASAEDCSFEKLTVQGVAGQGINGSRAVRNIRVTDCEVADCGAGGIYVGGTQAVIRNNHVHAVGRAYPSAIGIFRGGRECVVSHNEVHDCTYSAINYGGYGNIVESNLIYDCMKVLHDGAAIYMFAATNCILRGNLARDFVDTGGYGASAYYLDERSFGCVVENNVSVRVSWPAHNHMATNNVIRNNIFVVNGDAKITFPRSTDFTFERNVLHATGKIRFQGPEAVTNWNNNLLFPGSGKFELAALSNYSQTKLSTNPPPNTVVADPLFVDPAKGDYRLAPNSPAFKLGILPVDVRNAGRMR